MVTSTSTHPTLNIAETLPLLTVDEVYASVLTEAGRNLGLNIDIKFNGKFTTYTIPETGDKINYYASDMGFNTALSSFIARDKALCSETLNEHGVPCIEHTIFMLSNAEAIRKAHHFPLVLKPNRGGNGDDIHFVYNEADLLRAYRSIKADSIAFSPYVHFGTEYRVTVLDERVLMTYGKTKGENNQNNLSKGAKVIHTPEYLIPELTDLALRATKAIGLRNANVDIIIVDDTPIILEVNSTVALKRVAHASREFYLQSIDAYTEMLKQAIIDLGQRKYKQSNTIGLLEPHL